MLLRFFAPLLLLTGCRFPDPSLTVHTDYISRENLASYYVNTPDPRLNNPSVGQRLVISWALSKADLKREDLHLEMTLRFRNREEHFEKIPICKRVGTYVYTLMDEDYFAKRGILTYNIDLMAGECLLTRWQHQIWTELIQIEHTPSTLQDEELNKDFDID
jgi:hypothetical protein